MTRFSQVKYQALTKTAEIGMGLIWDDVYAALEPYNQSVVGGRVSGIGVAGLSLGGGYSWKTNQYGLTVDTIEAFKLVKPDGSIITVTQASQPELFFALKAYYFPIIPSLFLNVACIRGRRIISQVFIACLPAGNALNLSPSSTGHCHENYSENGPSRSCLGRDCILRRTVAGPSGSCNGGVSQKCS
ncbi:hypothetical protein BJ165DRAFT_417861 [Panaeolus papilionaceus]|nr:hypothetical protein BJ165DRAFT_417861 [Panaeolus papilionaceus]